MNLRKLVIALFLALITLAGCGGGGGPSGGTTATNNTVVTGIATKGPFRAGSTVKVYAVENGIKGALLVQTTTTDNNGSYSATLGSYSGPIIVEASGVYLDEATGHTVSVSESSPIRAALPLAQGTVTLPVTPLTELAVEKTGGIFTTDTITTANSLVSSVFKVDIIATLPVAPTTSALANTTQAQKDYTLALAAISQLASESSGADDSAKLATALTLLNQGISSTGMTSDAAESFKSALSNFVTANVNNETGISDTSSTSLLNVGSISKSYTLSLEGLASGTANGLQFELTLPTGVTVNINGTNNSVLTSSLALSSNVPPESILATRPSLGAITIAIVSIQGISSGWFSTLTCNIPSDMSIPPGSAFAVSNVRVVDSTGNTLAGVTVTVQ